MPYPLRMGSEVTGLRVSRPSHRCVRRRSDHGCRIYVIEVGMSTDRRVRDGLAVTAQRGRNERKLTRALRRIGN